MLYGNNTLKLRVCILITGLPNSPDECSFKQYNAQFDTCHQMYIDFQL